MSLLFGSMDTNQCTGADLDNARQPVMINDDSYFFITS